MARRMQTSMMDFMSKRPRLSESLESNGLHHSIGQNQDDCPVSDETEGGNRAEVLNTPRASTSRQENSLDTSKPKSKASKPRIPPPPSCPEIVRLAATSGEKGTCRFYNGSLRSVYASCTLPTVKAFAASHTISSREYSSTTEQRSQWKQTTHRPPSTNLQRMFSLSSPFSAHTCKVVCRARSRGIR